MSDSELQDYQRIRSQLIAPTRDTEKRRELTSQILRHKSYPKWLEGKLEILGKTKNLEAVLSEIRNNPVRVDDFTAILKIAAFFVSNGHPDLEFVPASQNEPRPDIMIPSSEKEIFIEVKLLVDTLQWGSIQDSLRAIPSGILVEIKVDFELYNKQVEQIVAEATKTLKCEPSTIPPQIDMGYATIIFRKIPGIPSTSTVVLISTVGAWKVVGDKDYKGESGEIRYSDIRRIFESRLAYASRQLSSVDGCRIVAFDLQRFFGDPKLLEDVFIGTPNVRFHFPRGADFYREADGLFNNSAYSSVDAVVTFIGDSPNEALANPKATQGNDCFSRAGLNGFRPSE